MNVKAEIKRRKKRLRQLRRDYHYMQPNRTRGRSARKIVKMFLKHAERGIEIQIRKLDRLGHHGIVG